MCLIKVKNILFFLSIYILLLCTISINGHENQKKQHNNHQANNDYYNNDNYNQYNRRGHHRQRHNKHVLRLLANSEQKLKDHGLFPPIFNIALKSTITANATCGQNGREEYCKMVDAHPQRTRSSQCGICDINSPDPEKKHLISYAIDVSNKWWQSPTLFHGREYESVTIDLDLGQIYQVVFVMIKSANSPRPASWILERSLDGIDYSAWQYFGVNENDCMNRFGLKAHNGKYLFQTDNEVICSTQYSKTMPLENGEIHVSLINGRPGVNISSSELLDFTIARYIRIRLVGMHSVQTENSVRWLLDTKAIEQRSFYSIRFIRVGGRCFCSGHADKCRNINGETDIIPECKCLHNTCGQNCEHCCPLFNQLPYQPGSSENENICEKCQCHGHAVECRYSTDVHQRGLSMNMEGEMIGGGVCMNCTKFTTGINCEKCLPYYYRPYVTPIDADTPCIPCNCDPIGSEGYCNTIGGECVCREGFVGSTCSHCAEGYKGENCTKCSCDKRGTMPGGECESHCQCKLNVEGPHCNKCSPGYFSLQAENSEGCMKCYCSGVTSSCTSSNIEFGAYETLQGWRVTDISLNTFAYPVRDNFTGHMVFGMYEFQDVESVYWLAPEIYNGNKLSSYGSKLVYKIKWIIVRGDTSGKPTTAPDLILIGQNGMKIAYGDSIYKNSNATVSILMTEDGWYHVPKTVKDIITRLRRTEYRGDLVTRVQFMSVLSDIRSVMIRGTFHTDQAESILERSTLHVGGNDVEYSELSLVEECECPEGYTGSSCENCAFGFVRIYVNSTSHEKIGKCIPCVFCNGHALTCDLQLEKCGECQHNTYGEKCDRCQIGYYGNPLLGGSDDCKRCECPLLESSNNFSPSCQLNELSLDINQVNVEKNAEYVCTQCPFGYQGNHCEKCDEGFFGMPTVLGSKCLPCQCNGGPCNPVTGKCIICLGNSEGWQCERCKSGYWGNSTVGCEECSCYSKGSISDVCDSTTGHCICRPRFQGRYCDNCEFGYANITSDCFPCGCNKTGSTETHCDINSGQCHCKTGVEGLKCELCSDGFYGFSNEGCKSSL